MGRNEGPISHWYHLVDGMSASARDFYGSVVTKLVDQAVPDIRISRVEWQESGIGSPRRLYLRIRRGRLVFDVCAAPFGKGYFFSWWLTTIPPPNGLLFSLLLTVMSGVAFYWTHQVTFYDLPRSIADQLWWARSYIGLAIGLFAAVMAPLFGLIGIRILAGEEAIEGIPIIGWLYQTFFAPVTYYRLDTAMMFQETVRRAVLAAVDDLVRQQGLRELSDQDRQPRIRDLARR